MSFAESAVHIFVDLRKWIFVIDDGYKLTFRSPKDQSPPIIEFDESSFAHAILFASETKSEYIRLC